MAMPQIQNPGQLTPAQQATKPIHAHAMPKFWLALTTLTTTFVGLLLLATAIWGYDANGPVTGKIPLYTDIDMGEWAKPHYIDYIAAAVAITVSILLYKLLKNWANYSGANLGWQYYKQLGWKVLINELWWTLLKDSFGVSSVFKHTKKRWIYHGFIIYGFTIMTISTTLTFVLNYQNDPHSFWWFPRVLGNLGGLMTLIGVNIMAWRLVNDPYEENGRTYEADVTFVTLLYLTLIGGFLTEYTLYGTSAPLAYASFTLHLSLVSALFISWPYTRFNHVVLTPFLVYLTRLNRLVRDNKMVPGMQEEGAPGRHLKTERYAVDAMAKMFSDEETAAPTLRYFP